MGFGKDGKGVIFRQHDVITLLTLGARGVVKQDNPPAVVDSFRMIKSEGTASMRSATLDESDGPIEIWLVSDDLSPTEIAECISVGAGVPLSREDRVGNEVATRPCFYLGVLEFVPIGVGGRVVIEWAKTIRWTFGDTTSFSLCAYNLGISALVTGGLISLRHTAYGVWVGA